MKIKVAGSYQIRIKKDAPSEFTFANLEKELRAESGLDIKFVLPNAELISFAWDDYKVRDLKRRLADTCDITSVTVSY